MEDSKPKNRSIKLEIGEDMVDGVYSNLVILSHSTSEFVLDFARLVPNGKNIKVKSRVVITPDNALKMYRALGENIRRYEQNFGKIKDNKDSGLPPSFKTPIAQA